MEIRYSEMTGLVIQCDPDENEMAEALLRFLEARCQNESNQAVARYFIEKLEKEPLSIN